LPDPLLEVVSFDFKSFPAAESGRRMMVEAGAAHDGGREARLARRW
jgi:hypothetical protein